MSGTPKSNTVSQYFVFTVIAGFFVTTAVFSQEDPNRPLLDRFYSEEVLRQVLVPRQSWRPFPTADDRAGWTAIDEAVRRCHIDRGEQAAKRDWPTITATLYLDYFRTGGRTNYERAYVARRDMLRDLVIAECMEGKGRFIDNIVNAVWGICEESSWCISPHLNTNRPKEKPRQLLPDTTDPVIELFSAETAGLMAWTVYLLGNQLDSVAPAIRIRVQREIENRILTPYLERNFWWMGFDVGRRRPNNWNPWCNSNCLTVALLLEQDETKRIKLVSKILKSLDRFVAPYPSDGGCDEGPGYWNHAAGKLFDCLEILHSATNGKIELYNEPLIQEMGRYIYRVHISENYFINFADADARTNISAETALQYGRRIGDEKLAALGAYFTAKQHTDNHCVSGNIGHQLQGLFKTGESAAAKSYQPPLLRDVWLSGIEIMAARSQEGSAAGLYVAAKGGHNGESHNHNDVGNFIVYADGYPVIIDVGVGTYTAKTFGESRYDIWTMQSAYHNLPTINGVMQGAGKNFAARNVDYKAEESFAQMTADIAGAYPPEAGVKSWVRSIRLNRGKDVQITDSYKLAKTTGIMLSLMTACEVTPDKAGRLILKKTGGKSGVPIVVANVYYDAGKLTPTMETIANEDARLKNSWGEHLTRIILRANSPASEDTLTLRITR